MTETNISDTRERAEGLLSWREGLKDTDSYACGKKDVKLGQRLLSGGDTALLVFTRKKAFPDLSSKLVPHLENGSRWKME